MAWKLVMSLQAGKLQRLTRRGKSPSAWACASLHEHAVAIGKEPVSLSDRVLIRLEHIFPPGKSRDQHEQCRFRKMEIGQQRAGHMEPEAGIDKDISLTGARPDEF